MLSSDRDEDILVVSDPASSVILKIEIKKMPLKLSAQVLQSYSTDAKVPVSLVRHILDFLMFADVSATGGIIRMNLETGMESLALPRTEFCQPHGLAVLNDEEIIFSDVTSHQVKKLAEGQNVTLQPLIILLLILRVPKGVSHLFHLSQNP